VKQIVIALLTIALTAAGFYWAARRRYKCPFCGRIVRYSDINCPHCGNDMKFRHRAGPEAIPRAAANLHPTRRRTSHDRSTRS
jgi:predicted RNA-binding Zn-ribbon protein involved in translation (DUF1610 family)